MFIPLLVIAGLFPQVSSQYACFIGYNETETILKVKIPEKIHPNDVLFSFLARDDVRIETTQGLLMEIPFFIDLKNVSVPPDQYNFSIVSNTNVTSLDDNEALCSNSTNWGFDLSCQSNSQKPIFIQFEVNYTNDHDPVLNQGLRYQVQELVPSGTLIADLKDIYTDRDCAPSKLQAAYSIEDGNTDSAFRLESRSNLVVNRLISYQKETYFELNISVTTINAAFEERTGFGKIIVSIIDIDDNDPVFDNSRYILLVQEENHTFINKWRETVPKIFAFDQDRGLNDTVTYSINGPSNSVEIDNETGLVWTTRVLDREVEPFLEVTIMANQVHNSWRSATATLFVEVEDINDNRPMFSSVNLSVSIPEHSATGSFVVRVLAIDADIGENANFSYTLGSEERVFVIKTEILVNQTYGTLIVANSSALDREKISFLNITVNTEEHAPHQGGDCSSGMCSLNITIELTDINDNSPVFDKSSYTLTVRDNTKYAFVGRVHATDADEGTNAEVRYQCLSARFLGNDACSVTTINDTTGDIWLNQSLVSLQTYFALVEACDNPDDVSQKRCTTVPLRFSLPPNVTVSVTSYNFTIHENSPPETYVGEIQNYDELFQLPSDYFQLDDKVLRTKVSLDREEQHVHIFVINTNDQDNTNISVEVTVLDMNDNAPVFDPSNGSVRLGGSEIQGQIITVVNATDDDEGVNAEITYSLQPQSMLQYFQINATSGVITLHTLPSSNMETMELLVKAADGGSPSLSGFYTLQIIVPSAVRNGSAVIYASLASDKIKSDKDNIQSELRKILGVDVIITNIRQESADSSVLYITARNTSSDHPLTSEELQSLVDAKPVEIADLFRQHDISVSSNQKSGDFTTPVIVLIAIGAVLLVALIVSIVIIARSRKSEKRHRRLIKSLSLSPSIYDTADEEERDSAAILGDTDDENNAEAVAITNPVFADDRGENVTMVNETEVTSAADTQSATEGEDQDVYENASAERPPDADSGVPSDRENGQEDDDDNIENSSNDGQSSLTKPRSATYLSAVLDESLRGSADSHDLGTDDAVDVTSPETYVNLLDGLDGFPHPDESLSSPPLGDGLQAVAPDEPPVDFEEQESYETFQDGETGTAAAAPLSNDEAALGTCLDPEVTSPDDMADTGSLDDFPVFPISARSTPPMVRKTREQRLEEELEPLPAEPLPDYGKKVRFNFQVTEHEVPEYSENDAGKDGTELPEDSETTGSNDGSDAPTKAPTTPADDTPTGDSGSEAIGQDEQDVDMKQEEEITSF